MLKKFYPICVEPKGLGERYEEEEENHEGDQIKALDALADDQHIIGLLLGSIRRLLQENPGSQLISFGEGLAVEGLDDDARAAAIADNLIVECEFDEDAEDVCEDCKAAQEEDEEVTLKPGSKRATETEQ